MRTFVVALLLTLTAMLSGAPAPLAQASDARDAAIRAVIRSQLNAFQRDDGAAAFSYASPMIQRMLQTPDRFIEMVRSGYMPVYRPREVSFRDVVTVNGDLVQRVLLVGPDRQVVVAHYIMEQQPDGSWRIDGCVLEEADDSVT